MISVAAARNKINAQSWSLHTEHLELSAAYNRVLAEDVVAPLDHPLFDQTAVDGYAFQFESLKQNREISVVGEIPAGSIETRSFSSGEAVRIFTGAAVPDTLDTVVMQEFCHVSEAKLSVEDLKLRQGANIRKKGEQIRQGELLLKKGSILNPAAIGLLGLMGIQNVTCISYPRIKVIITGTEFAESHEEVARGKIFESNGAMLQSVLAAYSSSIDVVQITDDLATLAEAIAATEKSYDMILISGGVSVGDYDFTWPALEAAGFEKIFHKITQKPGKPLLFSSKENCYAFGLPGNPRSALMAIYCYVLPFIRQACGMQESYFDKARASADYKRKDDGKTHFLTCSAQNGEVHFLGGQGSHMLLSFAEANCIAELPPDKIAVSQGDQLNIIWLS